MRCSRIKQNKDGVITDRKGTHHHWCALWKFSKGGEVQPALSDLHLWLLPPVAQCIALTGSLILVAGAVLGEVSWVPASETAVSSDRAQRHRESRVGSLRLESGETRCCLQWRSSNPSPRLCGPARRLWGNHSVLLGRRAGCRHWGLPFHVSLEGPHAIFLGNC